MKTFRKIGLVSIVAISLWLLSNTSVNANFTIDEEMKAYLAEQASTVKTNPETKLVVSNEETYPDEVSLIKLSEESINPIKIEIPDEEVEKVKPIQKQIEKKPFTMKLSEAKSCASLNSDLNNFFIENAEYLSPRPMYRGFAVKSMDMEMMNTVDASVPMAEESVKGETWRAVGDRLDFSKTNIQKKGVDEPDILKIKEWLFAYLNNNTIEIIGWSEESKNIISKLELPNKFNAKNMFIKDNMLLVLGNRSYTSKNSSYAWFDNNIQRTSVLFINLINPKKPSLKHLVDLSGYYDDARMIWDKLYVFGSMHMYPDYHDFYNEDGTYKNPKFSLEKMIPNNYNSYIENKKIKVEKKALDCTNISLVLPDKNTVKHFGFDFAFSTIWIIDVNTYKYDQQFVLWNSFNRHVSDSGIYLINDVWEENYLTCPNTIKCFFPNYFVNQYSLIHKFGISKSWNINYITSNLVPGHSINQYAMDEDSKWNFRIITENYSNDKWTSVFALDNKMNLKWQLTGIEPEEEFKTSRFIWDKLYLVTFKRTDPLFVVDMKDNQPKVLGELIIPWYSTYLHPYKEMTNNVQLLLGVGFDAEEKEKWAVNKGMKIDLYSVNYNTNPITIKQIGTKTFGDKWTHSPIQNNPRSFVWDLANKNMIFPIVEMKNEEAEVCDYHKRTVNWKVVETKNCYTTEVKKPVFAWTKIVKIEENGTITEVGQINIIKDIVNYFKTNWSEEYLNQFNIKYEDVKMENDDDLVLSENSWRLRELIDNSRAWYLWKKYFNISKIGYFDEKNKISFVKK